MGGGGVCSIGGGGFEWCGVPYMIRGFSGVRVELVVQGRFLNRCEHGLPLLSVETGAIEDLNLPH